MDRPSRREQFKAQKQTLIAYLKGEPTLLLTLTYLALTGVGLLYSSEFYSRFGIRYTDYAQTGDFLMASLKEPLIVLFFVGSVGFMYLVFKLDFWMRDRYSWYDRAYDSASLEWMAYHPAFIVAGILIYTLLYTGIYADYAGQQIRDGGGPVVVLERDGETGPREVSRTLLGTTGGFVFAYDPETGVARAIPHENVLSLRHLPEDRTMRSEDAEATTPSSE